MSPHSWVTPEQDAFLMTFYDEFVQCQAKRDYTQFWPAFYEQWFSNFPERATTLPEIPPETELSEEQKIMLGKAVEARKEQLRNRLRNKWGASKKSHQAKEMDTRSTAMLISKLMKVRDARTRKPQKIEVYLSLYYDEKIKPLVQSAADIQKDDAVTAASVEGEKGVKISPMLAIIMNKARKLFKAEPEEVKAKVEERWNKLVAKREKGQCETKGPQSSQHYIDRLAPTLAHFLQGLQELTGWSFSVLMGGPAPEAGGHIQAYSIHVGTTYLGNTFDKACPNFSNVIMKPYKSFLEQVMVSKVADANEGSEEPSSSMGHMVGTDTQNPEMTSPQCNGVALGLVLPLPPLSLATSDHAGASHRISPPNANTCSSVPPVLPLPPPLTTVSEPGPSVVLAPGQTDACSSTVIPQSLPPQMMGPNDMLAGGMGVWPESVLATLRTEDSFGHHFGSQAALEQLNGFLATYPNPLPPSPVSVQVVPAVSSIEQPHDNNSIVHGVPQYIPPNEMPHTSTQVPPISQAYLVNPAPAHPLLSISPGAQTVDLPVTQDRCAAVQSQLAGQLIPQPSLSSISPGAQTVHLPVTQDHCAAMQSQLAGQPIPQPSPPNNVLEIFAQACLIAPPQPVHPTPPHTPPLILSSAQGVSTSDPSAIATEVSTQAHPIVQPQLLHASTSPATSPITSACAQDIGPIPEPSTVIAVQPSLLVPYGLPVAMHSQQASCEENVGTVVSAPMEPSSKRVRQPSKRNQLADSIGEGPKSRKRRSETGGDSSTSRKRAK